MTSLSNLRHKTAVLEVWIDFLCLKLEPEDDTTFASEYVRSLDKHLSNPKRYDPFIALKRRFDPPLNTVIDPSLLASDAAEEAESKTAKELAAKVERCRKSRETYRRRRDEEDKIRTEQYVKKLEEERVLREFEEAAKGHKVAGFRLIPTTAESFEAFDVFDWRTCEVTRRIKAPKLFQPSEAKRGGDV